MHIAFKKHKNLLVLLLLIFFNSGGLMLPILTTFFLNDLLLNAKTIGFIITCFGLGGLIGSYVGGHFSDYIKPKIIIATSILANALFTILFAVSNSVALFMICMFFIGFFNASFKSPSILLLLETKGVFSNTKILGYRRVANSLGFAIASSAFGLLYHSSGRVAFFVIAGLFLITFGLSLLLQNKHIKKIEEEDASEAKTPNLALFIMLNIVSISFIMVFFQYATSYTLFLEGVAGLSLLDISSLFTIHAIFVVLFQIPIGHIADKINLSIACFVSCCFLAVGMGLTSIVSNFALAVFFCILWTIAEMVLPSLALSFIIKVSVFKKGKTMGMQQTAFSIGVLLAPLFGGIIYSVSPYLVWHLCFIISFLCGVFFLLSYFLYKNKY